MPPILLILTIKFLFSIYIWSSRWYQCKLAVVMHACWYISLTRLSRLYILCNLVYAWLFALRPVKFTMMSLPTWSRILDILILQDKTLFCACVDNFKQNGICWRHCACVDNFKQNGVFWRQHLPAVRVWTWSKYNKHHHDLKNQLCRFIDMYIGKIFWPTVPCRGCPEKELWGQG